MNSRSSRPAVPSTDRQSPIDRAAAENRKPVIGVLGDGQLGRMLAQAAAPMGIETHIFASEPNAPACQTATRHTVGSLDDAAAVAAFAKQVDVVTYETENITAVALDAAAAHVAVRPDPAIVRICQHRGREKAFVDSVGVPVVKHREVATPEQLRDAVKYVGLPAVLKTCELGYDGKGQTRLDTQADVDDITADHLAQGCVLEEMLDLEAELSVVVARDLHGHVLAFPPFRNVHRNHILDHTTSPCGFSDAIRAQAVEIAHRLAEGLKLEGLLTAEYFVDKAGRLLVNELAPRVHNSGHLTIEAHTTSQFAQQARAITGHDLGDVAQLRPAAMINLLGDLWYPNGPDHDAVEPDWSLLEGDSMYPHLYGKADARIGRKMGHLTVLDDTADEALQRGLAARESLIAHNV